MSLTFFILLQIHNFVKSIWSEAFRLQKIVLLSALTVAKRDLRLLFYNDLGRPQAASLT